MKKIFVAVVCLFVVCAKSYGTIETDISLSILETLVNGGCELVITSDEPYSHVTSGCTLLQMDPSGQVVRQDPRPISGFEIGWPRPGPPDPAIFDWPTLLLKPKAGETYCQDFGDNNDMVFFGHHSDPNQNTSRLGKDGCATVPPPLVTPLSPASVNGRFRGCRWGFAKHSLYISSVANASWYRVYANPGTGYQYEYSTASTTSAYRANGTAHIKAEACNAVGCSALSFDSYYSIWPCSLQ